MRQEVDIRYVVTSLEGSAQHLYENVYCQRGQMENLIKLHKAQLSSDRMSCHSATANQVRLVLHTAAFWLMHGLSAAIPRARVIEHIARVRVHLPKLPGSGVVPDRGTRPHAVWPVSCGAVCPDEPPTKADQPNALHSEWLHTDPAGRIATARSLDRWEKSAASCIIAVRTLRAIAATILP
jgi:Transposase DDE domain group 1